jgi:cytochrome c biogenesis protein CcdA
VGAAAFVAAFLGGLLALLAPCSALLLPAFLAYACANTTALLRATGLFLLGLCCVLLPLGLTASVAGQLLIEHRQATILAAGLLLVVLGGALLLGPAFAFGRTFAFGGAFPFARRLSFGGAFPFARGPATFATGIVYGLTGYCSGPLLGGVLTLAAAGQNPPLGVLLLLVYALGMTAPLLVLAALWDRHDLGNRRWLRASVRRSNVLAGALFVALGASFVVSQGGLLLSGAYDDAGLTRLGFRLEDWLANVLQL